MNKVKYEAISFSQFRVNFFCVGIIASLLIAIAAPLVVSAYTYLCQSPNYGFSCVSASGYAGQPTWGYPVDGNGHNCTNYAAYRLSQNGASNPGNLGHAKDWDNNASAKGFIVNNAPVVGSVAQWEAYAGVASGNGHVAYVESVTSTYIDVSEDNYGGTTAKVRYYIGQSDWPSHFIHITTSGTFTAGFQTAFNSGTLWLHGTTVTTNTGLGMAAGTSPSIAKLTNGNHVVAFQANTGNLWLYGASIGTIDTGYGMKTGTSPSVTALPNGGYQVAFQANTGTLWVHGTAGTSNTGLGMVAGTSPSITTLSNGSYQVAFNSGNLWLYGSVTSNTGFGMMGGTSPAITHLPNNGYEVAFNSGNLWVYGTAATSNTGFGMAPGTSPSITTVNGGFQAAFNSGDLWVYGTTATSNTGLGMVAGTSPSITSVGNGYQVAINSGNLWVHGNVTTANTGYGMVAGTSPAVSN